MKQISVLIPTFNRDGVLRECLDSVVQQTIGFENLEIIVVDDCSDEVSTKDIVKGYIEFGVRLVENPSNIGQFRNLNRCIDLGQCPFIHILHSDDKISPGFYEKMLPIIINDNRIGAVFSRNYYIDEFSSEIKISPQLRRNTGKVEGWLSKLYISQQIQTPSIIIRSSLFNEIGRFREDLKSCEDWDMWVRLSEVTEMWYVDEVLAYYRVHSDSTTGNVDYLGNFFYDLRKLQLEYYSRHGSSKILSLSKRAYSDYLLRELKHYSIGIKLFIDFIIYFPSVYLKLKFILILLRHRILKSCL
jgi:glycosyltransferase involved in cell wall biosynthesis